MVDKPLEEGSLSSASAVGVTETVVVLAAILLDTGQVGLPSGHNPFLCSGPCDMPVIGAFVISEDIEESVTDMDEGINTDDDEDDIGDIDDVNVEDVVDIDGVVGVIYTCAKSIKSLSFLCKHIPSTFALQQLLR